MSSATSQWTPARTKALVWLAVVVGLALLAFANVHLLYVAVTSQPDCVAHVRQGEGASSAGLFSAAKSSCRPGNTGS
jgi:hypothetical protein